MLGYAFFGVPLGIPAFCNFQGRAFYSDADVLYLSDIAEIWHHPMEEGKAILASGIGKDLRLGEMLWDCEAAAHFLPPLEELHRDRHGHKKLQQFFEQHPEYVESLAPEYSNLDGDDLPLEALKALHYSDMGSQFSHRFSLPRLQSENRSHWFDGKIYSHYRDDLRELFEQYYHEALAAGYTLEQYRNPQLFGHFNKQSQKRYDGNTITRKKKPSCSACLAICSVNAGSAFHRHRSHVVCHPPLPANLFRLFNLEKCHLHSFWVSFIIGTKTAL